MFVCVIENTFPFLGGENSAIVKMQNFLQGSFTLSAKNVVHLEAQMSPNGLQPVRKTHWH